MCFAEVEGGSRGGKSGRFRELKSQKIFSKTRFDRKYLGKHHGIGSFANQDSSVMANSNFRSIEENAIFIYVYTLFKAKTCSKLVKNDRKYLSLMPDWQKFFFPPLTTTTHRTFYERVQEL